MVECANGVDNNGDTHQASQFASVGVAILDGTRDDVEACHAMDRIVAFNDENGSAKQHFQGHIAD